MPRLTRRRFIVGASAALGGVAGVGSLAASRRRPRRRPVAAGPSPTAAPQTPTPSRPRGGIARLHSAVALSFDTFDAQRTGEVSVLEVLGRTHSRLVRWRDPAAAVLGPDLARAWEQPEEDRLILRLDPAARWHPRPPLDGAPVTADDILAHLERALKRSDPGQARLVQRPHDFDTVEDVWSAPEGDAVVIRTSRPDPFLLQTLAGRFALVQSAKVLEGEGLDRLEPSSVIGSGPFMLDEAPPGELRFSAHREGHAWPYLDGLRVGEPVDVAGRFRRRQLDEALLRDRRDAPAILAEFPSEVLAYARFEDSPVISTLFVGSPPWNNVSLQRALSAALNRTELGARLFGGRAAPSGPVAPSCEAFALSGDDLAAYAGYRSPEDDRREARRLWEAGGGPALGTVVVDFPAIFDPAYSASSVVTDMLNDALGPQFRASVDSYTSIAQRVATHSYGNGRAALWFGWGPPVEEPDPSRYVIETYSSSSEGADSTGYRSVAVDTAVAGLAQEFDLNQRKERVKEIARLLIEDGGGGILPWLLQQSDSLRWSWYEAPRRTPFWGGERAELGFLDPSRGSFGLREEG